MFDAHLNERKNDLDWPLLLATAALAVVGVLFVFSASGAGASEQPLFKQVFFMQIVWCLAGLAAAGMVCMVDYGKLARWARVIYWAAMVSLLAVIVIGRLKNGARRWIMLGSFSLQPSEFAKIAFIVFLADFLSRPAEELRRPPVLWAALGYTALPFLLILKEPDLGSSLAFLSTSLTLMFVAGVSPRFLGMLVGGASLVVILVVTAVLVPSPAAATAPGSNPAKPSFLGKLVTPYQQEKVREFLGLTEDYNVKQSLISVGSGGWFGKGWRQGTQHELGFLPKFGANNDFIFSVIAEEMGFIGSVVILALYSVLLFSGIKVAAQARDRLGQLLATGVVTLLFTHVFINIGMNIHLMPVTGIPLPLLSYGGSSVVCSLIAIGILHNVHFYRKSY